MSSNSIYSFEKVNQFLSELGIEHIYHGKRSYHLRKYFPDLYHRILCESSFLPPDVTFSERVYCFANNIQSNFGCVKCGTRTTFSNGKHEYHRYCSQRCALKDMKTLIGVENSSQLDSVKEKKKNTFQERYGVSTSSQIDEVISKNKKAKQEYWNKIYENKNFTAEGLTKDEYKHQVGKYTDIQYRKFKEKLDPLNLRGNDWHIDHIYSKTDGFLNGVPINVISDITNLRLIPAQENCVKNRNSHKTLEQLYEDFNAFHRSTQ